MQKDKPECYGKMLSYKAISCAQCKHVANCWMETFKTLPYWEKVQDWW